MNEEIKSDNIVVGNSYIVRNFQNALKIRILEKTKETIKVQFLDNDPYTISRYFNYEFDRNFTVIEDLGNETIKDVDILLKLDDIDNLEKRNELGIN